MFIREKRINKLKANEKHKYLYGILPASLLLHGRVLPQRVLIIEGLSYKCFEKDGESSAIRIHSQWQFTLMYHLKL